MTISISNTKLKIIEFYLKYVHLAFAYISKRMSVFSCVNLLLNKYPPPLFFGNFRTVGISLFNGIKILFLLYKYLRHIKAIHYRNVI